MSTLISSSDGFLTPSDFVLRVDVRPVGDWLSDNRVRLTPAEVLASPVLAELLLEATGEVEAAALIGDRLTPLNLTTLASSSTGAGALLRGITAGIALGKIWQRRPRTDDSPYPTAAQHAEQFLEKLRQGIAIFGFQEHADAGAMSISTITPEDVRTRSLASARARRMLGQRGDESPPLW